jgi:hypothetical protein
MVAPDDTDDHVRAWVVSRTAAREDRLAGGIKDLLQARARYDAPTLANAVEPFDLQPRDLGFADSRIGCSPGDGQLPSPER